MMERHVALTTDWNPLIAAVNAANTQGMVGVAVIGPGGEQWAHHGDRLFAAASTVKIPLMIEVYRQIESGKLALDQPYTLTDDDRAGGSGVMRHLSAGMQFTLADLLYLMISISDNTATNLLIRLAGMENVQRTMLDLGMERSTLARPMYGRLALPGEPENYATPHDYARVLTAILDGRAANRASCDAMIALMEKQQNPRRIARYLPATTSVRWGSKTGSNAGVTNDAGFILAPNGRLVIAVYTENCADPHTGEQVIGEIARAAMIATGVVGPLHSP